MHARISRPTFCFTECRLDFVATFCFHRNVRMPSADDATSWIASDVTAAAQRGAVAFTTTHWSLVRQKVSRDCAGSVRKGLRSTSVNEPKIIPDNHNERKINMKSQNLIHILIGTVCFGLLSPAHAVVPAPDGGYPGFNTAEGQNALFSLTNGQGNTAVGWFSLWSNAAGSFNTATGAGTLLFNTADDNTALGAAALLNNTSGGGNTATGAAALSNNTTGQDNTANGVSALKTNTEGSDNTATGAGALVMNTIGLADTATGTEALFGNTTGNNNTGMGFGALAANFTGNGNTAIGRSALGITTGSSNTALGTNAGNALTTGNFNIDIGVQCDRCGRREQYHPDRRQLGRHTWSLSLPYWRDL